MPRILLVEDDKALLSALKIKLEREGYEVVPAIDGEEALDLLKSKPDAILLDLVLPKKSGFEVLEEINKLPEFRTIPIIIISNSGQTVELERAKKLGVKDFLVKADFTPKEVIDKLVPWLPAPAATAKKASAGKASRGLLLLVEDDSFLRKLLAEKLRKEGFLVEEAEGGKEALDSLSKIIPTVIVLDLVMAGIDGFQVLEFVRKDERLKNTPVLVLSNLGEKEHFERAKALDADDYLVKAHFTLNEIVEKISAIISRRYT